MIKFIADCKPVQLIYIQKKLYFHQLMTTVQQYNKPSKSEIELWTCPKCKRKFERKGQSHSCREFAIERHFEGKPEGKLLYKKLKSAIKQQVGSFKVESLECCIHFVSTFTFAAVKIFKDKIKVNYI